MKTVLSRMAAGAVLSCATLTVNAAPFVTLDLLESRFINPVGGNVIAIDSTFGLPSTANANVSDIYWGSAGSVPGPTGDASGYLVSNAPTPSAQINADGTAFDLAIFNHFNRPITAGTAIDSVELEFLFDATFNDGAGNSTTLNGLVASFLVSHDETSNAAPCPYPSDAGNPCSDQVSFSEQGVADNSVVVGDMVFDLDVIGFSESIGGPVSPTFISQENGANQRFLVASVTTSAVPAPGALGLMGLSLLGLSLQRRWRRA